MVEAGNPYEKEKNCWVEIKKKPRKVRAVRKKADKITIYRRKPSWGYNKWYEDGLASKHFDSFKVYVIKCWKGDEEFIKIGKTFNSIGRRFEIGRNFPYSYRVLKKIEGDAFYISGLELKLHNKYKSKGYVPKLDFGGKFECFQLSDEEIKEIKDNY